MSLGEQHRSAGSTSVSSTIGTASVATVPADPSRSSAFDRAVVGIVAPAVRKSFLTSVLSIAVFSALLAFADPAGLATWIVIRVLVSIGCVAALARIVDRSNDPGSIIGSLIVLMGISGVVWGLLPAFIRPDEPEWQAVLVLWIFGNQSVVTAVCAADRRLFTAAVGSVTVVGAVSLMMSGEGFGFVLAGLVVLGGLYSFSVFSAVHHSTIAEIDARLNADALALSLRERQSELTAANATLEALAHSDVMTGLPNRRGFIAAVVDGDRCVRGGGWMGIVDLDEFKAINDTHGHVAGDQVLAEVARRWALSLDGGYIARTGGDEFAFVVGEDADIDAIAEGLERCLDEPVTTAGGNVIGAACSIGIARFERGETLSTVMSRADAVLYAAKRAGRSQVAIDDAVSGAQRATVSVD